MSRKEATGPLQRQVRMLDDALKTIKEEPTFSVWSRLVQLLSALCSTVDGLVVAVRGDGNGSGGLNNRMAKVESTVRSIDENVRDLHEMLEVALGIRDSDKYEKPTQEKHPSRRAEDQQSLSDRALKYFVDRVLPSLITWAIIAYIGFQIALNNKLIVIPSP